MKNEKTNENLDKNNFDKLNIASKSLLGTIPLVGPFLSEMASEIIPNQRIDRISSYIKILNEKISQIDQKILDKIKENQEFIDLIEESFYQAVRLTSDERKEYFSNIIVNGITEENISFHQSKVLLILLSQVNDIEILFLKHYSNRIRDREFFKKHKNVLEKIIVHTNSDKETKNKAYIQENYKDNLKRLKLIEEEFEFDKKTGMPKFDAHKKKYKIKNIKITGLGEILLENIGLNKIENKQE